MLNAPYLSQHHTKERCTKKAPTARSQRCFGSYVRCCICNCKCNWCCSCRCCHYRCRFRHFWIIIFFYYFCNFGIVLCVCVSVYISVQVYFICTSIFTQCFCWARKLWENFLAHFVCVPAFGICINSCMPKCCFVSYYKRCVWVCALFLKHAKHFIRLYFQLIQESRSISCSLVCTCLAKRHTHTRIYIWIFIFCELISFQCIVTARICFECSCNRMTISA